MRRPFQDRKAQITVFIIIGIIILFSVGIYSYLRVQGVSPVDMFQPKSPPVVAFVEACLEQTAEDAIKAMGDQGGYIVLPPPIALNPARHVSLVPGVGGEFAPKVPYWYFEGRTEIPGIEYMEYEVEMYINDNLGYCLNGFEQMGDEYVVTELSNYSADVVFADRETIVGLDYGIEIRPRGKDEVTERERFLVRMDVKVKRMWELAKEVLEAENMQTFYENMTINLMASHPSDQIPFTGMTFHCGRMTWLLSDIKERLIDALVPAVAAIRFRNTDHPPFMGKDGDYQWSEDDYQVVHDAVQEYKNRRTLGAKRSADGEILSVPPLNLPKDIPEDSYDYFQYYFRFTDDDYQDFTVVSTFKEDWGMNLVATPNQYGVLKSGVQDLKSRIMSFLCLNTYHFVYDLNYPVMVSINDPDALHRSGYVFRFAFPVQIFHNQPDRSLLPTRIVEPAVYDMDFCEFQSPEVHTIIARDRVTNAEISHVNLTFRCLREQCVLGETRTNNRHLQWAGNFPDGCGGAIIVADKPGYLMEEKQYDGTEPFYIDMWPTQELQFDVRRHTENAPDVARYLDPDMYAILQLELIDPELSIFEVFGGGGIFNRSESFELVRADATYIVNLLLVKKISEEEDRMIGGWIGNWTVRLPDILDARKVIFHIPQKYPTPQTDEEIIEVYELMSNRSMFPGLKPELVRADEWLPEGEQEALAEAGPEVQP